MYVHVHACVCAHICRLWTSAEVLWGPEKALSVLCYSLPIPLIKLSLPEPGVYLSLATLEASQPQGSCLHILESWVIGIGWKLGLLHEYWDLNSGPHNCMTSAESSLSPILWMLVFMGKGCNNWDFENPFSRLNFYSSQGLAKRFG